MIEKIKRRTERRWDVYKYVEYWSLNVYTHFLCILSIITLFES